MFIRHVQTRPRPSSDQPYTSFRLVRNERSGQAVRQVALLNLGANFDVPQARWPELVHLIENCLSQQLPVLPPDPDLLARAERLAEALRARGYAELEALDFRAALRAQGMYGIKASASLISERCSLFQSIDTTVRAQPWPSLLRYGTLPIANIFSPIYLLKIHFQNAA